MAIKEIPGIITIRAPTKEAGYEFNGKIWTKSSKPGIWAAGVLYCGRRGAKMQSLDYAVEFRHDTNGADNSAKYQHTGTLIAVVKEGKALRAHIYEPEQDELEMLASHEDIKTGNADFIEVDSTSDLGKRIIASTKMTGRTFIVPEKNLELSVLPANGLTEYGMNEVVLQLMPRCAEKNAAYIAGKGFEEGFVLFARPVLEPSQMRICPVGLGGDDYDNVDNVDAYDYFDDDGRSRGSVHVEQKISG